MSSKLLLIFNSFHFNFLFLFKIKISLQFLKINKMWKINFCSRWDSSPQPLDFATSVLTTRPQGFHDWEQIAPSYYVLIGSCDINHLKALTLHLYININKYISGYSTLVQFESGTRKFVLFTQTLKLNIYGKRVMEERVLRKQESTLK